MGYKQQQKFKRMATFIAVLSKYGFKDVLSRMNMGMGATLKADDTTNDKAKNTSIYVRIRMVLEELGPTFVKLGQALSNREDIFPKELIKELQHLQDNVEQVNIAIHVILEDNFGTNYKDFFQTIATTPLASASIAQVYKATLRAGEEVVLKVKRPNIQATIEADLLLMKDLAKMLTTYFEFAEHLSLEQAVQTFEKSLLNELSLLNEKENIERFRKYFNENKKIYVPKVYPHLCNNEVLCMEFIAGAKITNTDFHTLHQLNATELAERGLQLYLSQILAFGFFHADPHAGNILVLKDGRIVFIDMGAMATIYAADQELLEDIIINLLTKNITKLIVILKKMAMKLEIKDERKLHNDLSEILNMVNTSNLEDLNIVLLFNKFKDILLENKVIMPDYFTLLARGLMLIESVGRTLNPEMNLIKSVEPYVKKIIAKRLSPDYLLRKGMNKLNDFGQDIQNIPYELRNVLQQLNEGKLTFQTQNKDLQQTNHILKNGIKDLILTFLLVANMIITVQILLAQHQTNFTNKLVFFSSFLVILFSGMLFFRMMKK